MHAGVIHHVPKTGNWRVYSTRIEIGHTCDDSIRSFVAWMIEQRRRSQGPSVVEL